jgi:hypothetical protein
MKVRQLGRARASDAAKRRDAVTANCCKTMGYSSELTELDKQILHALTDGYYSIGIIADIIEDNTGVTTSRRDVLDRLEYLHQNNYVFLIINQMFDRTKLVEEIEEQTKDRPYWFGRTEIGYKAWRECVPETGALDSANSTPAADSAADQARPPASERC